jgi:hypothetical protein
MKAAGRFGFSRCSATENHFSALRQLPEISSMEIFRPTATG